MIVGSGNRLPSSEGASDTPELRDTASRILVMGEAGSGKTTSVTLLAQVQRGALLLQDNVPLSRNLRQHLNALKKIAAEEHITWPASPRCPFVVQLSDLARAIAQEGVSLEKYLYTALLGERSSECTLSKFLEWLVDQAPMIILDGLDEVPASSNRKDVCAAIVEFCELITRRHIDALVIVTTRPNSYGGDLDACGFRPCSMRSLDKPRVMRYAKRYAHARFDDSDKEAEICQSIEVAHDHPVSAALMRTPLGITVMIRVLSVHPRLPTSEYHLYERYFDVMYNREVQLKPPGVLRKILEDQDDYIKELHGTLGLLLQKRNEHSAGARTPFTIVELEELVRTSLVAKDIRGGELDETVRSVIKAVTERLVLLNHDASVGVGFSLHSFQEFWAAEALTSCADQEIVENLRRMAPHGHWLRVFTFCCQKVFDKKASYMCPAVLHICMELDEGDDSDAGMLYVHARPGAALAARLIGSNTIHYKSFQLRRFVGRYMQKAIDGLTVAVPLGLERGNEIETADDLVFRAYMACRDEEELDELFRLSLRELIAKGGTAVRVASGALLGALAGTGVKWAETELDALLNDGGPTADEVMRYATEKGHRSERLVAQWTHRGGVIAPVGLGGDGRYTLALSLDDKKLPEWMSGYLVFEDPSRLSIPITDCDGASTDMTVLPVRVLGNELAEMVDMPAKHGEWISLRAVAQFLHAPSPGLLAVALNCIAEEWQRDGMSFYHRRHSAPWPIAGAIARSSNAAELATIADKARSGELGDPVEWGRAEEQWAREGIAPETIVAAEAWPSVRRVGDSFVLPLARWRVNMKSSAEESLPRTCAAMQSAWRQMQSRHGRRVAGFLSQFVMACMGEKDDAVIEMNPDDYASQAKELFGKWRVVSALNAIDWRNGVSDGWLSAIEASFMSIEDTDISDWERPPRLLCDSIVETLSRDPGRTGLLNVAGIFSAMGYHAKRQDWVPVPKRVNDVSIRCAAAMVNMSRPVWGEGEGDRLAEEVVDLISEAAWCQPLILRSIQRHMTMDRERAAFIGAVMRSEAMSGHAGRYELLQVSRRMTATVRAFA